MRKADADPGIEPEPAPKGEAGPVPKSEAEPIGNRKTETEPELKTEVKTGGQREAEADEALARSEVEELG